MYGSLDFSFKPSLEMESPPAGKAPALVRGDTFAHVLEFWEDDAQTEPMTITGDLSAQIRAARLTGSTASDALADFTVAVDDNVVTISLEPEATLGLPAAGYWDLQLDQAGTITTLLAGRVKVLDDVTRGAA